MVRLSGNFVHLRHGEKQQIVTDSSPSQPIKRFSLRRSLIKSMFLLAVDRQGNEMNDFQLRSSDRSMFNEKRNFQILPQNSLTLILTTKLPTDRDVQFDLCCVESETQKFFRLGSIDVSIDDLIESKNDRILQIDEFPDESRQCSIYFSTFSRLEISVRTASKFELIGDFHRLLSKIGFQSIRFFSDGFFRLDDGSLFGHVLVHLADADDLISDELIVHFYAQ